LTPCIYKQTSRNNRRQTARQYEQTNTQFKTVFAVVGKQRSENEATERQQYRLTANEWRQNGRQKTTDIN